MTDFILPTLQTHASPEQKQQDTYLPDCTLKWRQGQLLVTTQEVKPLYLLPLKNQQWLVDRLKRSPVRLIRIDSALGETQLRCWADAGEQANKPVFLQVSTARNLPRKRSPLRWWLKRLIDRSAAALLLLTLSPVMLGLVLLIRIDSPGPILFWQWRVGERGKLFRILKFRTTVTQAEQLHHQVMMVQKGLQKRENDPMLTPLGHWMHKHSLDELPQFFNVLRGEMSLVGPRPWALYDAIRFSPEGQKRLNLLPGVTGSWQMGARSTLLDLDAVTKCDLEYQSNWSLRRDLKILLLTVPRVLLGFGAY